MSDDPRLLVVDDEEAICEGCRRIFARQGFQVQKSSDAMEGLTLAAQNDYAAVLLDIKMPTMDGIQFLEQLRSKKPNIPVILMTGYPSIPNAMSAIRLGAAGYVTKPFTPEEISQAVYKYLRPNAEGTPAADAPADAWVPSVDGFYFWNEAWLQRGSDAGVRVGGMLPRPAKAKVQKVRLPRIGEVVYQGLPLAAAVIDGQPETVIPAPVSGVVVAVNERLASNPADLLNDPCGAGWIATLSATRLEEELDKCSRRSVLLFSTDAAAIQSQQQKLAALGCEVRVVGRWDELAAALKEQQTGVLLMEASPSASEGPAMVGQVNLLAPNVKVILLASPECKLEAAYRARKIFYYAVEPFADNEIAEILDAAFRPHAAAGSEKKSVPSGSLASITITNRQGKRVRLMAEPHLLRREDGLGARVRGKLLERLYPLETTAGEAKVAPADILRMSSGCDHLVVLMARDAGRLPGSLVRDTKSEFVTVSGEAAGKVTTLVIQPNLADNGSTEFDPRTLAMLAEHIVSDMGAYY